MNEKSGEEFQKDQVQEKINLELENNYEELQY